MADDYSKEIADLAMQRASASLTLSHPNPDAAAKANGIARTTGLPVATVDDNLALLDQQVRASRAKLLVEKSPQLMQWVSDPRNAAVSSDDMDSMGRNAKAWGGATMGAVDPPEPTFFNAVKGIWNSVVQGGAQMQAGFHGLAQDWIPDLIPHRAGVPQLGDYGAENAARDYARADARIAAATPDFKSKFARYAYGGVSSFAQMVPSMAMGVIAGPEAGLALGATQQGVPAYEKYRSRGATRNQALLGGSLEGGIEAVTEKLPMQFLVDKIGKLGTGHFIAGFLGRELPGEMAATLGQNAVDTAIANPDKTWGQYLSEQPDQLAQTAIGTLMTVGAFAGANKIAAKFAERDALNASAFESADALNKAMDAAGESKTRGRDPEAFRSFIDRFTTGSHIENVFVPAEKVATYFQSHDGDYHDDPFWRDYAHQVDEGLHTGGDVVIPTSAAAAHLAGTPTWEAIKGEVRTSPGGPSMAEVESQRANYEQAMQQAGAHVSEQLAQAREADAPRQQVYQDIRDKLTNAGYTQDAAHMNAELVAQRYATRAERTGVPLAGTETQRIGVNAVLPEALAPIAAKGAGDIALQGVINLMRRNAGAMTDRQARGASLAEWIAKSGGIEDKGGDLKAMGADTWHRGKPGMRKLIRPHADVGQGRMFADNGQQNANTPDELALRAQEAGYFPPGDRPSVNDLLDALGKEVSGKPHYADYAAGLKSHDNSRQAAEELAQILDRRGIDPAKATDGEIRDTLQQYQQEQANGLRQVFADGPRGQISFGDGKSIVDLFESRNASTFLHEMGHQWLEELKQDATSDTASDQTKADWQAVQDWFSANGHTITDGMIPVDAHELWARGTERFLMEGKTPSSALRRVFDAFRSWMLHIYQVVDNLRSPITPEIRDVMQRLFATDEEIAQASEQQQLHDLFDEAAKAGMSEQEFAAYKNMAMDARNEAHDQLLYKTMSSIRASRTKAWRDEEANVRSDITDRVNKRPEFRALELLRTGKMLGEPDVPVNRVKLDRQWLIDHYGEGILSQLPGGVPPLYKEGGTHPDEIAELAGFANGDEMVRTLVTLQERKKELLGKEDKRSVKQALIDEETKTEMQDRHGDPLNDGSTEQEALALVQNDLQGEKMATELRVLGRRSNRTPTPYSMAKDWARTKIADSTVQEATSGSAIQRYSRASAKAGKAAEQAMMAGDVDETFRQKQAQMLNNALVAEASKAREAVEKARDRLASYARRRTVKSMDQDYLDQIHALLEDVEFRTRSQASLERQQSFAEWAAAREAEGHDVIVPLSFAASLGQTHWSRLTVDKMLGLDDAVQQIAHLGRFKQELIDGAEKRAHEEVVGEAVSNIANLPPRPPVKFDPSWADRMKSKVEAIDGGLLKMETIIDWLDGGNANGVFNRMAFRPVAEAQSREQDMTADYFARIREAMSDVPNVSRWSDRVTVPELIDKETGQPLQVTRQRLVAMALNMGNEGNIQRVTDGHGWNREAVLSVLNRELTAPDWKFVQRVWDTFETLWPEISAMERRINGVEPEKVDAVPIETSAGTLRGGYYPAVYDTTRDLTAQQHSEKASDLLDTNYTRATTRASATKDRLNKVKRPILLDLGVINRHLGEVIHDITHREAIINAHKFLSDSRVQKAVNDTLGPEIRKQFQPWLKHVANQWAAERAGNEGLGKFMGKLRANTTAVGMGFRLSTIFTQAAGFANTQEVIGSTWLPNAIAQSAAHPVETFNFVTQRSGEIRHRMDTLDRDIGALMRSLDENPTKKVLGLPRDAARFMYHGIGYADRLVVVPTWIAAYNKALASGAEESNAIYEADKAVRQSQGAGAAKDLAAIQRGTGRWGEALKLSTMFYSYFSAVYQRQRSLGRDATDAARMGRTSDLPKLLARAWWLVAVPPVLSQLLVGKGPQDDEDWGTWAFKQMLFNALGSIPFVRDLAQPTWDKAAGNKSFGYQMSPVQRAGDTIVNVAGDAGRIARGQPTKTATRDVLDTAGYTTGLVPGQVSSAAQFMVDVGDGTQSPDGVGEWYRGLTTGHAKPPQQH